MVPETFRPRAAPGSAVPGVAVIGLGAWGRNLARCFAELGALVAVVDHHASVTALASKYGVSALRLDEALADAAVDAVVVGTQPSQHMPVARAALGAGKHVFVEKPLASTLADAEALAKDARSSNRILMTGHLLRYHPAFEALEALVRAGKLGRLLRLSTTRLAFGAVRHEEDALWCLAPHDVSMALALAGEMPERVAAHGDFILRKGVADAATVHLGFPSGLTATLHVSWLHPVKEQRLAVVGSDAMAVFDDTAPWTEKLTFYAHRVGPGLSTCRATPEQIPLVPSEPLLVECAHFLECIVEGRPPRTGPGEALPVIAVLERAGRCLRAALGPVC